MSVTTYDIDRIAELTGQELGRSDWIEVDQARVDAFAEVTGDRQWIHVDPGRAKDGPYGGTIAHGYLTLSLLPVLVGEAVSFGGASRRVNYGLDKVRFPAPVRVGTRVRAVVSCRTAAPIDGGVQLGLRVVVESESGDKPACVADTVTLLIR